jgi:hypothetical protein
MRPNSLAQSHRDVFDQRNIFIPAIRYLSLVWHSPWILLPATSYSASICSSITVSCQSLFRQSRLPFVLGVSGYLRLCSPFEFQSISALFKFDLGTTQASHLVCHLQANISYLLFRWTLLVRWYDDDCHHQDADTGCLAPTQN